MRFVFGVMSTATTVLFDGESTAVAVNRYNKLATYTPVAGDRVAFLYDGANYILIGKVVK